MWSNEWQHYSAMPARFDLSARRSMHLKRDYRVPRIFFCKAELAFPALFTTTMSNSDYADYTYHVALSIGVDQCEAKF